MRNKSTSMKRRIGLVGALVAGLIVPVATTSQMASAAGVSATQAVNKYFTPGVSSSVIGIQVSGLEGKQVFGVISTNVGALAQVSLGTTTGLTLAFGYTSFTGSTVSFTGTQDAVNTALRTLKITVAVGATQSVNIKTMFTESKAGMVYSPQSEHFYKYVAEKMTGAAAFTAAAAQTEFGLKGYLATITNDDENEFLSRKIDKAFNVWVNGTDQETEGTWKFQGGPEDGTVVWKGNDVADGGGPVNGNYVHWASGEPNNWNRVKYEVENSPLLGEDCNVLNKYSPLSAPPNNTVNYGAWNDLSCLYGSATNDLITGYIVEFGTKTVGSTYDNTVDIRLHTLVKAEPKQFLTPAQSFFKFLFGGLKKLSPKAKVYAKPKPTAPKQLCPSDFKKTRISYSLLLNEAGRYSVYFTDAKGRRIPMQCGSIINKRTVLEPISAPIIETTAVNQRPVITAYLRTDAVGTNPCYPLLNVILRRSDGTLARADQPIPPLPGSPIESRAVGRASAC